MTPRRTRLLRVYRHVRSSTSPHQTGRAVFPHPAFRCSSRQRMRQSPTRFPGNLQQPIMFVEIASWKSTQRRFPVLGRPNAPPPPLPTSLRGPEGRGSPGSAGVAPQQQHLSGLLRAARKDNKAPVRLEPWTLDFRP